MQVLDHHRHRFKVSCNGIHPIAPFLFVLPEIRLRNSDKGCKICINRTGIIKESTLVSAAL